MSFRNFDDFNAAESELILDKAAEPLAGVIGCASRARALAQGLPQRYRRGYTNVQVLVVDHETGDVTDKTTPERVSAVEELITRARAGFQFLKDRIEYYSTVFQNTYSGKVTVKNGGARFLLTELGGALFSLDMENGSLEESYWDDRAERNVTLWESETTAWTSFITHLPNREVLASNSDVLFRAKVQTVQYKDQSYEICLFRDPATSSLGITIQYPQGWHFYQKANNQWTRVGESSAADWVTAMSEFGFTSVNERVARVRFSFDQGSSSESGGSYSLCFDASGFASNLIYDKTKLDDVINALP